MCGIAGISNSTDVAAVAAMVRAVSHRGPDGVAWQTNGTHSFGAARLTITGDPAAPAFYRDCESRIAVLLNGEIYNAGVLRAELLAAGESLQTDLETELIARLYVRHGKDFAQFLQGMFAVAVLDGEKLLLARDRMGIKPLYYTPLGESVAFGSEIKALLVLPQVQRELDLSAFEEMCVFGYIYSSERTPLSAVRQVPPGATVSFSREGSDTHRYWQPPAAHYQTEQDVPYEAAVQQLRECVIRAVDRVASHGGHPLGIYLSGGIDSTILTLVTQHILGYDVTTFSANDDEDAPDLNSAREVARRLGTTHVERRITLSDYMSRLEHFTEHYECPLAGGVFDIQGGMAFHLLTETVADHVKVAFSGEGADELFGGYYWIYTHPLGFADRIRDRAQALPISGATQKLVSGLFPDPEDEDVFRRNLFDALIRGALANYHLQSVDRSAGAFGFEIRPAYLADEIVAFALSLPIEYKVPNRYTTKRILRDAFRKDLEECGLEWVADRKKEGMPAAVRHVGKAALETIGQRVSDAAFASHPMRRYLRTRADVYLYELFRNRFLG